MKRLTEKVLKELGFKKNKVSTEESGDKPYHYFTLELTNGECLISNENDSAKNGEYKVKLFNTHDLGVCETDEEVRVLYKALMRKEL